MFFNITYQGYALNSLFSLMVARVEGWGKGVVREFGIDMYPLLYLKWITDKGLLLHSTRDCSMLHGSLDGRGVWGRKDTCICMAELLCCASETIILLIVYSPI